MTADGRRRAPQAEAARVVRRRTARHGPPGRARSGGLPAGAGPGMPDAARNGSAFGVGHDLPDAARNGLTFGVGYGLPGDVRSESTFGSGPALPGVAWGGPSRGAGRELAGAARGGGIRPALRLLAAGLTGLAGLALIGYVLLRPAGSGEEFGWEPVTEEARLAVEQATASDAPPPASPSGDAEARVPAPAMRDPAPATGGPVSSGSAPAPAPDTAGASAGGEAADGAGLLDLNRATAAELDALPGIGPAKAQAIVEYRNRHGAFRSVDQLLEVKGIGPKMLERIRPLVTVGGADRPGDGAGR